MKRLILAAMLLSAVGVVGVSRAECTGPVVTAGDHGDATVTWTADGHTMNIHTASFGNFLVGPVKACAHGARPRLQPTSGYVELKVDGAVVCTNTNSAPLFDPFVFGGGVHDAPTDPCGADVTWDGLTWLTAPAPPAGPPDPTAIGAQAGHGAASVHGGDEQPATVSGVYWYGGGTYTVPDGTVGWFSNHGAQVDFKRRA
jgi:hypothetical protein